MELVREVSYPYQPYALAYQGAVLIELVDAVVADVAVGASRRTVDVAGPAELELHLDAVDDEEPPRSPCGRIRTCFIFYWWCPAPWYDSGVSCGSQQQTSSDLRRMAFSHQYVKIVTICTMVANKAKLNRVMWSYWQLPTGSGKSQRRGQDAAPTTDRRRRPGRSIPIGGAPWLLGWGLAG